MHAGRTSRRSRRMPRGAGSWTRISASRLARGPLKILGCDPLELVPPAAQLCWDHPLHSRRTLAGMQACGAVVGLCAFMNR